MALALSLTCSRVVLNRGLILELKRIGTRTRMRRLVGPFGWHRAGMK